MIYTPEATLTHYESLSRGAEDTLAKQKRFAGEVRYMQEHWAAWIKQDPHYPAHLSLHCDDLSFRQPSAQSLLTPRPST